MLMKNCIFIWISSLVFCLWGWSCSPQDLESHLEQNVMTLTVSCMPSGISRAETRPGVLENNENLIKTLDYFFYPKGQTNQDAILKNRVTLANGGSQNSGTVRITIDEEILANLFPQTKNECEVFVVANLPEGKIPTITTLENLKKVSITTAFQESVLQSSFIMVGEGIATVIDRNQTVVASADIQLERLAAKLTIRIKMEESVIDDGKVWKPEKDYLKLTLRNAANETTLNAEMKGEPFDFAERTSTSQDGEFYVFAPFYSYPREWDIINTDALAFYIDLPWTSTTDGTDYEHCYYKVMPNTSRLDPNNWYHMDLTIGVIGSETMDEDPVPITDVTYKVVDWANGNADWSDSGLEMDTELLEAHYLVVEKNLYEVDNLNTLEIPFISSHTCEIDWSVQRYNFKGANNIASMETLSQNSSNSQWITLNDKKDAIELNHILVNFNDNNTDDNYDYATYIYTVTLKHQNDDRFTEVITIRQNPALVIEPHSNSGYKTNMETDYGYYFVNGCKKNSNDTDNTNNRAYNYGGASGPQSYHTKNPSMYVVETTVLPEDSKYILGDPRDFNFSFTDNDMREFVKALPIGAVEGSESQTERTLSQTNYHPTLSDASVQEMISPKFRIASSYGVCTSAVSYAEARKRCATYQEDGYPAGRWRIPTKAEVQFMIRLSDDDKIPQLFNTTYWCANGTVTQQGNFTATTTGSTYVRCVYDEWYWEKSTYPRLSEANISTFVWGDE